MARAVTGELRHTVGSAASGDEAAFGRIVAAYHDDMRRVCRFITRDDGLAEDATQVAWIITWPKLGAPCASPSASSRGSSRSRPRGQAAPEEAPPT